jgi:hypothetical protein
LLTHQDTRFYSIPIRHQAVLIAAYRRVAGAGRCVIAEEINIKFPADFSLQFPALL